MCSTHAKQLHGADGIGTCVRLESEHFCLAWRRSASSPAWACSMRNIEEACAMLWACMWALRMVLPRGTASLSWLCGALHPPLWKSQLPHARMIALVEGSSGVSCCNRPYVINCCHIGLATEVMHAWKFGELVGTLSLRMPVCCLTAAVGCSLAAMRK